MPFEIFVTLRKEETLAPICCKQQRKGVQGLQHQPIS